MKGVKVIILAAGYGTRLRPLTNKIPKCLVPIDNKPLLGYWLDLLIDQGFIDILINTHYLSKIVENYVSNYVNNNTSFVSIATTYEKNILGTAGTVWNNQGFIGENSNCIIINGDLLSDVDLKSMYSFHVKNGMLMSLGYVVIENPIGKGIMEIDSNSKIVKFEEKPENPFSNKTYSGIQVINSKIFEKIPFLNMKHSNYTGLDFGYHIWPNMVGHMVAYKLECFLMDVGDQKSYEKAEQEW